MPSIDEIKEVFSDSEVFSGLTPMEKKASLGEIERGVLSPLDLIQKYGVYEILSLGFSDEERKKMVEFLTREIRKVFLKAGKYGFDLALSFIYKGGDSLRDDDVQYFSKKINALSFVARELLFDLESVELARLGGDDAFAKIFDLDAVISEVSESERVKKNK